MRSASSRRPISFLRWSWPCSSRPAKASTLPLIYNTNAYDSLEVLRLLDGIVDIYLPDLKYGEEDMGYQYLEGHGTIRRYARAAIAEMHRQVGSTLVLGDDGLVKRGLIIRHLVLPERHRREPDSLTWVRQELGEHTTLSIMSQYFPTHKALTTPLLDRKIRESEYERVLCCSSALAMDHGWAQEYRGVGILQTGI